MAPSALGRGVIVAAGAPVPPPWEHAPRLTIDEGVLATPAAAVTWLHDAWAARSPVAIELAVDPARFRRPETIEIEPWRLEPDAEPWFDRLHFLVWANNYDGRDGALTWWWGVKAARLSPGAAAGEGPAGDLVLADGTALWIDGGPRRPWAAGEVGGLGVVHAESVELGVLHVAPPPRDPAAALAADQLAAVRHDSGPARIVAPAGSGKTRVLTERLRHLHVDRGFERAGVVAVAYNKQAQLEMQTRTADFGPRVRTLNSLGLTILTEHRGRTPAVLDERETRRLVERLMPGRRPRRSNTDPIGPYLEALAQIRLGLTDPQVVEDARDDVPGVAEMFDPYRRHLTDRGVVDFDEQIYGAIETLLRDGEFRRRMQASHRHVLVDEFQDLTPAHVLLVRLLALPALDVFGVGDDDQCIYGHAGADPAFLIDYAELFPGAGSHPLEVNYRCPVEVVGAARTLLDYNRRRLPKTIQAGPDNDPSPGSLVVVGHRRDDGATACVEVVRGWLDEPEVSGRSVAVLARVNSLLLAPHVALHVAGVPISSVLRPDVLDRTGLRAALAYLRIAASPRSMNADDIVEILRRPTRGLPQWFPDRLRRRAHWTVGQVRGIGSQVSDKDASRVDRLADDLALVTEAGRGTTRQILEVVRDGVGLRAAMSLLDQSGGSSHLDDLEGLLGVADLHPDPVGFEAWLREAFQRESDEDGVTLSTIHRVKGREWDRVAVFGVTDGIVPHRLAEDVEEERRVLHVAITRGRHHVALLADETRRSPFLDELAGTAPQDRDLGSSRASARPAEASRRPPPAALSGAAASRSAALRAWRAERARTDGVPAYVVLNDKHLDGIAAAGPTSPRELIACDGIGPTKLERYGDEILAVIDRSGG